MNKNNLTKALFAALLLVSGVVSAEEQYPASDFQPTVVYQDPNYKASSSAPAKQEAPASQASTSKVDEQYPAANFQPQVVYSDNNYKHDKSVPAKKNNVAVSTNNVASATVAETDNVVTAEKKKEEDSSTTYLLGLIGLAAAGFFLFRNQSTPVSTTSTTTKASSAAPKVSASTGVAKYINKVSGTGVSRYLEQQVKTAKSATGVAKYVDQKTLADKARAAEEAEKKVTGVEKYMRNRG